MKVKPLSLQNFAGIAFRYQTNKHHYLFALAGGTDARLVARGPIDKAYQTAVWREIARQPFSYDTRKYYQIRIENQGPSIRVLIDGKPVIEAKDDELKTGKVALAGTSPARFQAVKVSVCPRTKQAILRSIRQREARADPAARAEPATQAVETILHPQLRSGTQRPLRRPRR